MSLGLFDIKEIFLNFTLQYIDEMWRIEPMQVTPGGPYTHEDQYETGAAQTAARPFLYKQKKYF